MFEHLEVLRRDRHADLRFQRVGTYGFARDVHMAPLAFSELAEAARTYPIVFLPRREGEDAAGLPQALFGLTAGENQFVDEQGQWTADYVPAHLRRYPFVLGRTDDQDSYAVMFDPQAPHFAGEEGEPVFDTEGKPIGPLQEANEFLMRFQAEIEATRALTRRLDEAGVLTDRRLVISRGEEKRSVQGFRTVDDEAVRKLDDATLGAWARDGVLRLVYIHQASLANLRRLAAFPADARVDTGADG